MQIDRDVQSTLDTTERLMKHLRLHGVVGHVHDMCPDYELVSAVRDAIHAGDFSITAAMHLQPGGFQTAIWCFLNGEEQCGHSGVRAKVRVKNIGAEPVHFCTKVKLVKPKRHTRIRTSAKVTVNGRPLREHFRFYDRIDPGEVKELPIGRGVTLLGNHCRLTRDPFDTSIPDMPAAQDLLREVGGYLDDGAEVLEWKVNGPEEVSTTRKSAAGRSKTNEAA